MPQLSPLNWVLISVLILVLVFIVKIFMSFMTVKPMSFLSSKGGVSAKSFLKWNW